MTGYDAPEHLAWWGEREAAYLQRPDVQQELRDRQEEIDRELAADRDYENRLHDRIAQGDDSAQRALNAELTRQAYWEEPPLPSAMNDPREWEAFFLKFYGRPLPDNARFQAELHQYEADAPADVGGQAAMYYETHSGPYDYADLDWLAAERRGLSFDDYRAEQDALEAEMAADSARYADETLLASELWVRPASGGEDSGPFTPAEALARARSRPPGEAPPVLLFESKLGGLLPLAGDGNFSVDGTSYYLPLRWPGDDPIDGTVRIAAGLPLAAAAAAAERISRMPEFSYSAEVTASQSGKPAFRFVHGTVIAPGADFPGPAVMLAPSVEYPGLDSEFTRYEERLAGYGRAAALEPDLPGPGDSPVPDPAGRRPGFWPRPKDRVSRRRRHP